MTTFNKAEILRLFDKKIYDCK